MKAIKDSVAYATKIVSQLPGLYYVVFWNSYLKDESI